MKKINEYLSNNKFEILIFYFLSFIYIFPRVLSNSDYNDDIFRSTTGDANWWYYNGRPLTVRLMHVFNQNVLMSDSTPLPVILGMTFFVICSLFLMKEFLQGYGSATKTALCSVFIINPFFISNITYKYDCLPMCLALGLSIIASLIGRNKTNIFIEISRFFILISILCIYQAALSLIISLIAIDLCVRALSGRIDIRLQIFRAITIVFSYGIYSKFIGPHYLRFIYIDMAQHIPLNHDGILILKQNIKTTLSIIAHFYHGSLMRFCIISYAIIYALGFLYIGFKPRTENQTNRWISLGAYASGLCVIMLCTLGLTIFLKSPDIQPRVLLGTFGFILSAPLFLTCISRTSTAQFLAVILCALQIIPVLSLSFSFGNYLTQENTHDSDTLKEIEFHLIHYPTNSQTKITFLNDNPATPSMVVKQTVHPLITNFMATQGFGKRYNWYSGGLLRYNSINYELDDSYQPADKFVPTVKTCHVLTSFVDNHVMVLFQLQC